MYPWGPRITYGLERMTAFILEGRNLLDYGIVDYYLLIIQLGVCFAFCSEDLGGGRDRYLRDRRAFRKHVMECFWWTSLQCGIHTRRTFGQEEGPTKKRWQMA